MKALLIMLLVFSLSACGAAKRKDIEIVAAGSIDNERPYWTYDDGVDMEKLRKDIGDDPKKPEFMLVSTSASVKSEDLIPNCYSMARTRGAEEISSTIAKLVKESSTLAHSKDATEFEQIINKNSKQMIIGAEVAKKSWIKITENGDNKFYCYTLLKMPRKNLKALQDIVVKKIEREEPSSSELKEKVKMIQEEVQASF